MYGFGAILLQKDCDTLLHPINFMSKKTTQTQQRYHSYELEFLAIVEAMKKFRSIQSAQRLKVYDVLYCNFIFVNKIINNNK